MERDFTYTDKERERERERVRERKQERKRQTFYQETQFAYQ